MKKQETFMDIEYSFRKKKTKREEFLEIGSVKIYAQIYLQAPAE